MSGMQIQWSAIDRQASKSSYVMPTSHDGIIPSFLFSAEILAAGWNGYPCCSIRRNTAITDIILTMFMANRANDAAMVFSLAFKHRVRRYPKQLLNNECCPIVLTYGDSVLPRHPPCQGREYLADASFRQRSESHLRVWAIGSSRRVEAAGYMVRGC